MVAAQVPGVNPAIYIGCGNVQIAPFLVDSFSNSLFLESSFNRLSLSPLGVPESSENSFAVSEGYFEKSFSQVLLYSLFVALVFNFKMAIS